MTHLERQIAEIEKKYGNAVSRVFVKAMQDLRNDVQISQLVAALERGDVEAAMRILNIDDAVLSPVRTQLAAMFNEIGVAVVAGVKFDPPRETFAKVRWNTGNPEAVRVLNEWLGDKITRTTSDTLTATRSALSEGLAAGKGPRDIALEVVGRIDASGNRTGGILGLNSQQQQYVRNMERYLREGDLQKVLRMSKRDKRFDASIRKLIREGKQPTEAQIKKWVQRYSDRLLKLRGDTIARTETAGATEIARFDAFRQMMDQRGYPYQYAIKEWRHGGGGMTPRVQHVAESQTVVEGLYTPFVMPDGTRLLYPHDPNAPPNHVINCTCSLLIRMDWPRMRRDGII